MRIFTCDEARSAVGDLLSGALGMSEGRSLDAHLAGCSPCTAQAEALFWQDRTLAELALAERIDKLMTRIRAGIAGVEPKEVTDRVAAVKLAPPSLPLGRLAAAAAALVAVAAGVWFLWPRPPVGERLAPLTPAEEKRIAAPAAEDRKESVAKDSTEPHRAPEPDRVPVEVPKTETPAAPRAAPKPTPEHVEKSPLEAPPDRTAPVPAKARPEVAPPQIDVHLRTVEMAVRDGLAFLRAREARAAKGAGRETRSDELLLWTMLASSVPPADPDFQAILAGMLGRKLERTYPVALQAMLLEELDRVKYQGRIAQCAQFLLDNQCRNGQWSYGEPSIFVEEVQVPPPPKTATAGAGKSGIVEFGVKSKPKVVQKVQILAKRQGPPSGDNSNTMYAALGLRACHDAGVILPKEQIEPAARWWREAEIGRKGYASEGWCYGGKNHCKRGYGSMTAGAVGSLVIYDYILGREWKRDLEVRSGMDWLARNFSVSENPGTPEHGGGRPGYMLYYYLYALERAAILYGTEKVGTHDWYEEGKDHLLRNQNAKGYWACPDGGNDVWDTCFAILFLRRAIPALQLPGQAVETGGKK